MVIAQPALEGPDAPVVSSTMDPLTKYGPTTVNPTFFMLLCLDSYPSPFIFLFMGLFVRQ